MKDKGSHRGIIKYHLSSLYSKRLLEKHFDLSQANPPFLVLCIQLVANLLVNTPKNVSG